MSGYKIHDLYVNRTEGVTIQNTLNVTGNTDINGTLNISGTTTLFNDLTITKAGTAILKSSAQSQSIFLTETNNGSGLNILQIDFLPSIYLGVSNSGTEYMIMNNNRLLLGTAITDFTMLSGTATFSSDVHATRNYFKVGNETYNLFVNSLANRVGVGISIPKTKLSIDTHVIDDYSYTYDENALVITHQTNTSNTVLNDPKNILYLTRQGTSGEAFGAKAIYSISRYENVAYNSRTRLDLSLANGSYDDVHNMTWLSNGNVGIGTTNPTGGLHVNKIGIDGQTSISLKLRTSGGLTNMIFGRDSLITDEHMYISKNYIRTSDGTYTVENSSYGSQLIYFLENGNIDFKTASAGSGIPVGKMTISSNGNVGIGTDNPTEKLEINGNILINPPADNTARKITFRYYDSNGYVNPGPNYTLGSIDFAANWGGTYQLHNQIKSITSSSQGSGYGKTALAFMTSNNNSESATLVEKMRIEDAGHVGINTTNPLAALHIKQTNTDGGGNMSNYNEAAILMEGSLNTNKWGMNVQTFSNFSFTYNLIEKGYLRYDLNQTNIDFTGQHRSRFSEDNIEKLNNINDYVGLIVCSTATFSNPIDINEALPNVELSTTSKDKRVYGVISNGEDTNDNQREYEQGTFVSVIEIEENDHRAIINSIGEGGIWVCNENGPLENGDYITTSNNTGYGMKQDEIFIANYTVAKITQNEDFSDMTNGRILSNGVKCKFVGCTYHCG